ncbi:hypothetical protein [Leeuwenhoekiella sp. W20_SRS_FM14]|uniref:hypothetical protein n=1 Tax=Leeuwenhoekiella sp. W20_SRS_FM14 TaxID=3240270 RepID=UPI003F9B55AA
MDRLSFYKSFYETELRKKDDLDKSINNPILIITIIFGIISYISQKVNFECLLKTDFIIVALILIISLLLCKSIFHIILSYNNGIKGYNYEVLGTNTDFESYRKNLIEYNENEGIDSDSEKEFEESIITELIKCSDVNNDLNIKRTYQIYLTKKYLIISLIIAFATFIIHLLKQII